MLRFIGVIKQKACLTCRVMLISCTLMSAAPIHSTHPDAGIHDCCSIQMKQTLQDGLGKNFDFTQKGGGNSLWDT